MSSTAEQFETLQQQRSTDVLGMWIFLASEILFFGALLLAYTVYRIAFPETFVAASAHLQAWLAGLNTALLLTSSLTIAMAEKLLESNQAMARVRLALLATLLLGCAFLAIKGVEYHKEYVEGLVPLTGMFEWSGPDAAPAQMFFNLYFSMTGLHALHLLIGIALIACLLLLSFRSGRARLTRQVEVSALYWHFVDIVWVFLFPLLYLIR